jgi:holliday junction DNA helicase RuvA
MIAHLRGRLLTKEPNRAVVDAGGVGYEVTISIPTYTELPSAGAEVALHVYTHVREDALALYGFVNKQEKQLFEKLISVSGIGPKLAVTVLSGMSTEFLVAAIRGNDVAQLTRIPGIGKKTAERMVLELRDKLQAIPAAQVARVTPIEEDVLSALLNLGYQQAAAEKAVAKGRDAGKKESFDALFRESLAQLRK